LDRAAKALSGKNARHGPFPFLRQDGSSQINQQAHSLGA
jgi:hypothetical protein